MVIVAPVIALDVILKHIFFHYRFVLSLLYTITNLLRFPRFLFVYFIG